MEYLCLGTLSAAKSHLFARRMTGMALLASIESSAEQLRRAEAAAASAAASSRFSSNNFWVTSLNQLNAPSKVSEPYF